MATQAIGAAAQRSISLTLSARDDGSLTRVFGRVSRELQQTSDRLSEVRARQRSLREELRQTERGTDAYRALEEQIRQAGDEVKDLTREVDEQQRQWGRLTGRAERYGNLARTSVAAVGAAAGALLLTVTQVGEKMTQALTITDETGLAIEEIQRIQNALGAVGRTLDGNDLQEFATRLGDARQQMIEGTGPVYEALERIGLRADQLTARDLPLVISVLQAIPDAATRAFEADEILGGQLSESLRFYWALPEDVRRGLEDVSVLTRAQAEEMVRAGAAARQAGGEIRQLGVAAAGTLVPALDGALEVLTPIVRQIGAFTSANPALVQSLAALGVAIATITTLLWGLNAAKAAALALAGPRGWLILGGAAGLLAAGGIAGSVGAGAAREQAAGRDAIRELERRYGQAAQESQMVAVRRGAETGVRRGINDASASVRQRQLSGILPGVAAGTTAAGTGEDMTAGPGERATEPRSPYVRATDVSGARRAISVAAAEAYDQLPDNIDRRIQRLESNLERYQKEFEDPDTNQTRLATLSRTLAATEAELTNLREQRARAFGDSRFPDLSLQAKAVATDPSYVPLIPRPTNPNLGAGFGGLGGLGQFAGIGAGLLAEQINVYVESRADDAQSTADAVRGAIESIRNAGRGE